MMVFTKRQFLFSNGGGLVKMYLLDLWSEPDSEVFSKNILTQGMTNGHGS